MLGLALDNVFFPKYRRVKVRGPVIMIGHPRSGTTFLHRLLTETHEFCVFEAWELFFPSLTARKLVRRLIHRRIAAGKSTFFSKDVGHEMLLNSVEEEEMLFLYIDNTQFVSCVTPLAFSDAGFAELVFADDQPPRVRRKTMAFLNGCFQRQIYATGKPQIVAKMNYSGMRVRSLLEAFPDAKIVYIVRSPLETIPSHLTLDRNTFNAMWGLDRIPAATLKGYYERRYRHDVEFYQYLENVIQSGAVPADRFLVVRYDDLRNNLGETVRQVVRFTGLQVSAEFESRIQQQSQEQKSFQRKHQNLQLEEFGLSKERIVEDLAFVFDKYGFER